MSQKQKLYSTTKGESFQDNVTNKIIIHFENREIKVDWYQFKSLRQQINSVKLEEVLFDLSDQSDFLNLYIPNNPLRLTLCSFVQLKELIDGTMFSLQLNSMLCEVLGYHKTA
ncbi:hypothetical protein [Jiulongibacter sp. NS-SX5]|uniref:hypothetical protein n=1 Tax=Jiulongibacter sp. NS-SX5 TaxID=3463854 RepID=UPI00405A22E4